MAIQSVSEFEAILMQVISRLEKELGQVGNHPTLEKARDDFRRIMAAARDSVKLKGFRAKLSDHTDAVSVIISDEKLLNQLWDLLDFIDYRA